MGSSTAFGGGGGSGGVSGPHRYVHDQATAATVWTVEHNLDAYPSVTVVDSAMTQVEADVDYIDENSLTITFGSPNGGYAFIN